MVKMIKVEVYSSSALASNSDEVQKSAHEDKLKRSLKRLIYSEASNKSCLSFTAYSEDSRAVQINYNKSESEKLLIQSLIFSWVLNFFPVKSICNSSLLIRSAKTGQGRNLWSCRQPGRETVCSQNNRKFLLLMRLGFHIFPWDFM